MKCDNDKLSHNYNSNINILDTVLQINNNFDIIGKNLIVADRPAKLYFIDGFAKDEILEKILEFIVSITAKQLDKINNASQFSANFITYIETDTACDINKIIVPIMSGTLALVIDGFNEAILIDARTYPVRGITEPEDDRVLRGSHDGFVETLIVNTALIRRRIRDTNLTMDILQIGDTSKTDVVLCSLSTKVDKVLLKKIKDKLLSISINSLTMSQESLAECLLKKQWYNPFPKIRYTERPDVATACILEGNILIIVDNSPSVMVLPTSFFDFFQETNDFYFSPIVGTYLRFVRIIMFGLTLLLTPVWYLLIENEAMIPSWLQFIKVTEPNDVPIIFQLLIVEFVIDGLKLASLNTPSVLSSSFSVVGALILGDFAVKAHWFVPEVVLYMAFIAIATFTQPSYELGYAFKMSRVLLLILTALFNIWGFLAGIVVIVAIISTTKTISGYSYLFPLIPFNFKKLLRIFIRTPIDKKYN